MLWLSLREYDANTFLLSFYVYLNERISNVNAPFPSKIYLCSKRRLYAYLDIQSKSNNYIQFYLMHAHILNPQNDFTVQNVLFFVTHLPEMVFFSPVQRALIRI